MDDVIELTLDVGVWPLKRLVRAHEKAFLVMHYKNTYFSIILLFDIEI